MKLLCARQRRKLNRGLKRKPIAFLKRLRKAKKECPALEKPACIKTHLRDMIVLPEMVGSIVGIYNGKTFNQVEIKVRIYLVNILFDVGYKSVSFSRKWSDIFLENFPSRTSRSNTDAPASVRLIRPVLFRWNKKKHRCPKWKNVCYFEFTLFALLTLKKCFGK